MTISSLNVADLEGSNGFVINGTNEFDCLGYSVSSAGDLNGDGFADLIIGAPSDYYYYSFGKIYVVFGGTNVGSNGTIDLDTLDGTNGFLLNGTTDVGDLGLPVSDAGDINGDGFADLFIGARGPYFSPGSDRNYVVFGGSYVGYSGSIDLDTLDGYNGFVITGEVASSVSGAGDINGDGFEDLIIGVPGTWFYGSYGYSYLVFGGTSVGADGNFKLSDLDGSNGFRIKGINERDAIGTTVSGAGDINGDGFADLIIGAYLSDSGASYVVFGGSSVGYSGSINLDRLDGTNGFVINDLTEYGFLGDAVSSAGDINGDGFADLIIGAPNASPNGRNSGASYVVFGGSYVGYSGSIDLDRLDGSNGFAINGLAAFDKTGISVSSAGDINGDGFDDLIIGAPFASPNGRNSGASYVVFGGSYVGYSGSIDLSTLDGSNGFAINGIARFDRSGYSVSGAGDINGDGFDDLIIGAPYASPNGVDSGASYVVFGGSYVGYSGSIDLDILDASNDSNGFVINGTNAFDCLGYSVSGAGDINGDGFADLIIGAPGGYYSYSFGKTYVVFGGTNVGSNETIDLDTLDGTNGFLLNSTTEGQARGVPVSDAGDINGDGFADLFIGVKGQYFFPASDRSYVVFGGSYVGYSGSIDLDTLDGYNGFVITGEGGFSVSGAGDINGDGFEDLIIGVPGDLFYDAYGYSYLVFGGTSVGADGNFKLSDLDGSNGFRIKGINERDATGTSVSGAGDINGDGFDDLIIGAPFAYPNGTVGASYVVFGGSSVGYSGSINLDILDGTNGFVINGLTKYDLLGDSVSSAGDINGDGFADLIIGAPFAYPNGTKAGASYVVFGGSYVGYSGSIDLSTLNGSNGFAINGITAFDKTGSSVSSAGDINGDGFDDLIIGAPSFAYRNDTNAGASYVVFGGSYVGYSGSIDLSTLNGSNGFAINGAAAGDLSGYSVSGAGDINGDGFADLIIGAPFADPNGNLSGASYVVFGGAYVGYSGSIDLDTLDANNDSNGFVINGIAEYYLLGYSVSSAGDINGDGIDDLIIGAPGERAHNWSFYFAGQTYVVFGGTDVGTDGSFDLSSLDGSNGFVLNGTSREGRRYLGHSVSNAGDINGDGFGDLIIGARSSYGSDGSQITYVVFGGANVGYSGSIDKNALDGTNGFVLNADEHSVPLMFENGTSVSGAGDINGDGFDDLIIGFPDSFTYDGGAHGHSYVVFGGSNVGSDGSIDLSFLDGSNGFHIQEINLFDGTGKSVSSAGDINGDGFDDLIIGADYADPNGNRSGASYVVFGNYYVGYSGSIDLSTLDGSNGFVINGLAAFDSLGFCVSGAGDVNGDGFADLIIGAPDADPNGTYSGASYVVFGGSYVGYSGSIDLSTLDGSYGFIINGSASGGQSGFSVSSAGDINGDGFDDLIIGAPFASPNGNRSGASYVVFGGAYVGYSGSIDLSTLDGTNGFVINGSTAFEQTGFSVSGAGDINGDGFADLIIGAPDAQPNGFSSGAAYVLFGGSSVGYSGSIDLSSLDASNSINVNDYSTSSLSHAGNETLFGGNGIDTLSSVGANNLLQSGEADDLLSGGLGNAHLVTGEANNIVSGSTGSDRFLLRADQAIYNITNFEDGQDLFTLSNGLTFGQLAIAQSNGDTLITLKSTSEVLATLTGVPANLITASDFLLFS